jgi:hypothetical protein
MLASSVRFRRFCRVERVDPLEEQERALIAQRRALNDVKPRSECMRQVNFRQLTIEVVATTQPFLKHLVRRRHPFEDELSAREAGAEFVDVT